MALPLKKLYITKQIELIELWNTNQFVMAHPDPLLLQGPDPTWWKTQTQVAPLYPFIIHQKKICNYIGRQAMSPLQRAPSGTTNMEECTFVSCKTSCPWWCLCSFFFLYPFSKAYTLITIYSLQSYCLLQDLTWQIWLFSPSSQRGAKQDFPHIFFILITNSAYQFVPVRF